MTKRERLLGIAVGCLLAMFTLYGTYSMVNRGLNKKRDDIASVNAKVRAATNLNERGKRAEKLLYEFRRRSLPAEPDVAHRAFTHWLENKVKEVGLQKESIRFQGIPNTKKPYKELSYNISGVGNVKQLTKLLYAIHSADNLQRVQNIVIRKQKDNDLLKLDLVVDALSMDDIDAEKLKKELGGKLSEEELAKMIVKNEVGHHAEQKLPLSLEEYETRIAYRNSFSPANLPPKLVTTGRQEVEVGKRLSVNLTAEDPDGHDVVFELGSDAPESMEITESGRLSWRPAELGEYEFKVYLVDSGIPSKETVDTIKVEVVPERVVAEPPQEDPFDEAKWAVLTAIVQGPKNPQPQMCMYLRSEDEIQYLQAGDRIRIGEWSGVVTSVEPDRNTATIQTEEGEYVLQLGQALSDAKFIKPKEKGEAL